MRILFDLCVQNRCVSARHLQLHKHGVRILLDLFVQSRYISMGQLERHDHGVHVLFYSVSETTTEANTKPRARDDGRRDELCQPSMPPCVVTARYHADSHHITPTSFAQQRAMVLHIALSIARTHCVTGNTSIGCSSTSSHVCEQFDQGSPACRLALSRLATTSNRIPSTSIGPAFRSAADGGPSYRLSHRSQ